MADVANVKLTIKQIEAIYLTNALNLWQNVIGSIYARANNESEFFGRIFKNGSVWVTDFTQGRNGNTKKYTLRQLRDNVGEYRPLVRF